MQTFDVGRDATLMKMDKTLFCGILKTKIYAHQVKFIPTDLSFHFPFFSSNKNQDKGDHEAGSDNKEKNLECGGLAKNDQLLLVNLKENCVKVFSCFCKLVYQLNKHRDTVNSKNHVKKKTNPEFYPFIVLMLSLISRQISHSFLFTKIRSYLEQSLIFLDCTLITQFNQSNRSSSLH